MDKNKTKKLLITLLGTGLWTGYSPFAPGTAGTFFIGIPLFLLAQRCGEAVYGVIAVLLFLLGCKASEELESVSGKSDPSEVVIDEIVGYLVTMAGLPGTLLSIGVGFILFRFFDILKPWPVRDVEKQVRGGVGVMLDDVLAGLYAHVAAVVLLSFFP